VGLGLGMVELPFESVTLIGFFIFFGGLVWVARYCIDIAFNDLYTKLYKYLIVSFLGLLPYAIIVEPSHPIAAATGQVLQQLFGTTLLYSLGAGFFWTFFSVLLMMGYKIARAQYVKSDGPPSPDDL